MLLSHGGSSRGISCLLFTRMVLVPNYRIIELVYFHTEHRGESRFYCPGFANCRIFLHTDGRGGHGLFTRVLFLSRIIELSNSSSHGESRRVSGFMSRIIELTNLFSHGRLRRFSLSRDMFLVPNLRIVEFLSLHGWSRRL